MNVIMLTDLIVNSLKNSVNNEAVVFKQTAGGIMASFSAREKSGNGFTNWCFQAFDASCENVRKANLKSGDVVNITGTLNTRLDPKNNRYNTFCKIIMIEKVNATSESHSSFMTKNQIASLQNENQIEKKKQEKTDQNDKMQIEKAINTGALDLSLFDPFARKY